MLFITSRTTTTRIGFSLTPATHPPRSVTPGCSSYKGPSNLDGTKVTTSMIIESEEEKGKEDKCVQFRKRYGDMGRTKQYEIKRAVRAECSNAWKSLHEKHYSSSSTSEEEIFDEDGMFQVIKDVACAHPGLRNVSSPTMIVKLLRCFRETLKRAVVQRHGKEVNSPALDILGGLLVKADFSKRKIECFLNEEESNQCNNGGTVPLVLLPTVFKRLKCIAESGFGENDILIDTTALTTHRLSTSVPKKQEVVLKFTKFVCSLSLKTASV